MEPDGPLNLAVNAAIGDGRGRLLLLRTSATGTVNPGRWEFPGGGIRPAEGVRDALVRTVREETGLAVEPGRLLGAAGGQRREGRVVHMVLAAAASGREVALSGAHDAHRWVTPKGLAELPLADWMERWYAAQRE